MWTQPVALCARVRVPLRHPLAFRRHRPGPHVQQRLAFRRCHQQCVVVRSIPAAASTKVLFAQLKVQRIERHRLRQLFLRKIPWRHAHHHPRRAVHVVAVGVALVRPSLCLGLRRKPVSRSAGRRSFVCAHRYPQNIRGIGLQRDHPPIPLQHKRSTLCRGRLAIQAGKQC
jgi:hypothetical protein